VQARLYSDILYNCEDVLPELKHNTIENLNVLSLSQAGFCAGGNLGVKGEMYNINLPQALGPVRLCEGR